MRGRTNTDSNSDRCPMFGIPDVFYLTTHGFKNLAGRRKARHPPPCGRFIEPPRGIPSGFNAARLSVSKNSFARLRWRVPMAGKSILPAVLGVDGNEGYAM